MSHESPRFGTVTNQARWWAAAAAVFLIAAALLLLHLGHFPLMKPDEVRNAEVAREMHVSGSWLVPTYNGLPYLDKPAFFFRAVALAYDRCGVDAAAARLPSACCGLLLLAATFWFARRVHDLRLGVLAVLAVATMPITIAFSRIVIMDMMLTLFICSAIFCGYLAEQGDGAARRRWHLAGALCGGLATLVKGPIGFLLPWLVLTVFYLLDRRPRAILRLFHPLNLVALFAVVLPWFFMLSHREPPFARYGLVEETFSRLTTGTFRRRKPLLFYVPLIAGACFSWSILIPGGIAAAWRARGRWLRLDRLSVAWACAVVIFFSLPRSKQPAYILSVAVPLGLLVARLFTSALDAPMGRSARTIRRATALLAVLCVGVTAVLLAGILAPDTARHWFNSSSERMDIMRPHLLPWAVASMALALAAGISARLGSIRLALAVFASVVPLLAFSGFRGLEAYARTRSEMDVVDRLPDLPPRTEIVCLQCFPAYLPFYLGRTVTLVTTNGREIPSNYIAYTLARAATWPANVVPLDSVDAWLAGRDHPVYVISDDIARPMFDKLAATAAGPVIDLSDGYVGVLLEPRTAGGG